MAEEERHPLYSYKEVRVSSDPPHPSAVISIHLPTHPNAHHPTRPTIRAERRNGTSIPTDETAFAKAHLATSAAIYFRHNRKHPRSFLWRVLEDGRVLSIQCVDLNKSSSTTHDPFLTLRFTFPNPIRPAGVAFADSEKHTSLSVFVITAANDLYTLTLPAQLFHQSSVSEGAVDRWCKTFLPSSFSFRYPHRLVARTSEELWVSLHDGGLLRLTRPKDGDGTTTPVLSFGFAHTDIFDRFNLGRDFFQRRRLGCASSRANPLAREPYRALWRCSSGTKHDDVARIRPFFLAR
jgi:hypothetical protein